MLSQYVHNVNANVEENLRYLTDVIKVSVEEVAGKFRVTAFPVVPNGVETITQFPVHPATEAVTKQVATYEVPEELPVLVKGFDPTGGDYDSHTWEEILIPVSAIVDETFADIKPALKYYEEIVHQLYQGDIIKGVPTKAQDQYERNVRY